MNSLEIFKKQNALIDGFFANKIIYKEVHHNLLNLFMLVIQHQYKKGVNNFNTIVMSKYDICRKSNINYIENILPLLKDLIDIKYEFTAKDIARLKKNGLNITGGIFAFITVIKENTTQKEKSYSITFNPELFSYLLDNEYCIEYGNYTNIRIADINSLSGKYQKLIAELILANKYKKEFSFKYEFLMKKLFSIPKRNAYLIQTLNRHLPRLKEKFIDFDYTFYKKDKLLTIKIL